MEPVLHGVVWLAGLSWAGRWVLLRRVEWVHHPLNGLVLLAAVVVGIRYGFTEVEAAARPGWMRAGSAALLFFVVLENGDHRRRLTWLMAAMTTGLVALLAWAGWRWWAETGLEPSLWKAMVRVPMDVPAPDEVLAVLLLMAPILTAHFFFSRWPQLARVGGLMLVAIVLAALVFLRSVGAWMGVVAGSLVLAYFVAKRHTLRVRWVVLGTAVWVALVAAAVWLLPPREVVDPAPTLWAVWTDAAKMLTGSWWNGIGGGMFEWRYPQVRELLVRPSELNNAYLEFAIAYGLVGLAVVLWMGMVFLRAAAEIATARISRYSADAPSNRYAFPIGAMAGTLAVAVASVSESLFRNPAVVLWLAAIGAEVLRCAVHPQGLPDAVTEEPGGRRVVWLQGAFKWAGLVLLAASLTVLGWRLRETVPGAVSLAVARTAHEQLDWPKAELWYARAAVWDPNNYHAAMALGDFFAGMAAWRREDQPWLLRTALQWYAQAARLHPFLADAEAQQARMYDQLNQPTNARQHLERALRLDPRNAWFHTLLGQHLRRWGEVDAARQALRRALELDPSEPTASRELAQLVRGAVTGSPAPGRSPALP